MLCTSKLLPAVVGPTIGHPVASKLPRRMKDEMNVHVVSRVQDSISFPFQGPQQKEKKKRETEGGVDKNSKDGWTDRRTDGRTEWRRGAAFVPCGTTKTVAMKIHYQQTRIPRMTRGRMRVGKSLGMWWIQRRGPRRRRRTPQASSSVDEILYVLKSQHHSCF